MVEGNRGFTLIELLLVIGTISILFLFSLPGLARFKSNLVLEASARSIASELRKTQALAVCRGQAVSWRLSSDQLPTGIEDQSSKTFIFSESGFPPPGGSGTQVLATHWNVIKKIVVSSVGRVRIE